MPTPNSVINETISELSLKATLSQYGYCDFKKIINTTQGSIWRVKHQISNQNIIVKVANKYLYSQLMHIAKGKLSPNQENIISEATILQQLNSDYVTKYYGFFSTNFDFVLAMEDGGDCLFDWCVKAHALITKNRLDISEWHNAVKVIFKQMLKCVEYIHSQSICHFDISLENFLVTGLDTRLKTDGKVQFNTENIKVKLCDFGAAHQFAKNSNFMSTKYTGKNNYKSNEVIEEKKPFNAKSNDIWCLGVSIFMLIVGSGPFVHASKSDKRFIRIMNGNITDLLREWNKIEYVNNDLIELFSLIFREENERCNLNDILYAKWIQ